LIFEERDAGRTIFFSTHILGDVEAMCDRVTILRKGEAVVSGPLRTLLRGEVLHTDVVVSGMGEELRAKLEADGFVVKDRADVVLCEVQGEERVSELLGALLAGGCKV